ncbi:3-phosphoshikimate 1-carboxyvinyltransferase [Fructilactobacillus frigidiflavus]|uniref:3-phosphoshikimate 1-carboxyvinyltransferase n=1 Tax=Fructilactobacillus frigidiflavus TaxID=3242688 RepID=UPI0037571225
MKKLSSAAKSGLHGTIVVPGDKSISHRAIMLGAISEGDTMITHFLEGEDCLSTLQAFRDLGVKIDKTADQVVVHGKGENALHQSEQPLDMGNSGTTTRLMMGLLAGLPFASTLIGDASLSKRPMKRVSEPLKAFGVTVETTDGKLPATVKGGSVHAANYQLQVASAQVKSALILASLFAEEPSTIIEALPTRNHTEIMLRQFGADVKTASDDLTITVQPHPQLTGQNIYVPGDISSAAFFMVAAAIIPGSDVVLKKVNLNPTRTGILKVLEKMQAAVTVTDLPSAGEPIGDIRIKVSHLKPITLTAEDVPALVDEIPLVALLAACADGVSEISGAEELRVKETDRIVAIANELRKLGVKVTEKPDGMTIIGQSSWKINNHHLDSYGDHRIGMMTAIAALRTDETLYLQNPDSINISYPNFFEDLAKINQGA